MVEVSSDTAEQLENLAEENDVEFETVREVFREKYEEAEEKAVGGVSDEKIEHLALRSTRTEQLAKSRIPTEEIQMLTIGGDVRNWSNGDTFVGKALVDLEPNEDRGRNYISTVIIDAEDVNLGSVSDAFSEVGNVVTGEFSVSEAHTDEFRVINSSEDTEIDVTKPSDRTDMVSEIRDAVPEASIENITENMSQTERNDDGDVYPASFGVDIRRMEVDIFDGYKNPAEGNGIYTVRDDTVFDEQDIEDSAVFQRTEETNENATPGMTCFLDPSKMQYGTGSVVEIYGTIAKDDDGVAIMNVDAILPVMVDGEFDGYEDNSSSDVPEREDSSSNVDRTSI